MGYISVWPPRFGRRGRYKYSQLPHHARRPSKPDCESDRRAKSHPLAALVLVAFAVFALALYIIWAKYAPQAPECDTVEAGYRCQPAISHHWGQYSPFFSVPWSAISTTLPNECTYTFAQVLSRHGARDPTASKTVKYNETMQKVKHSIRHFSGDYSFLKEYEYSLGSDQLTVFGENTMVNSGIKFYDRYKGLAKANPIFVRVSGQNRVVISGLNFTQGYHAALLRDNGSDSGQKFPYDIVTISEEPGSNNTLDHILCSPFEKSTVGSEAQTVWANLFVPPIQSRLNADLPGAELSLNETVYLMDLCPFETVASPTGQISPFCRLFRKQEWLQYDYFQSLGKYYGFSHGNPLGPTQGVGFANELIARLTGRPVQDNTSTNSTLDSDPSTFPIDKGHVLFADFSHDNDIASIHAALGLYNDTQPLLKTKMMTIEQTNGFSAAWTVPFGSRTYIEKMKCAGEDEELVRILVNDRVVPLEQCGADDLGRCKLSAFVESLAFARGGGKWNQCFV